MLQFQFFLTQLFLFLFIAKPKPRIRSRRSNWQFDRCRSEANTFPQHLDQKSSFFLEFHFHFLHKINTSIFFIDVNRTYSNNESPDVSTELSWSHFWTIVYHHKFSFFSQQHISSLMTNRWTNGKNMFAIFSLVTSILSHWKSPHSYLYTNWFFSSLPLSCSIYNSAVVTVPFFSPTWKSNRINMITTSSEFHPPVVLTSFMHCFSSHSSTIINIHHMRDILLRICWWSIQTVCLYTFFSFLSFSSSPSRAFDFYVNIG